MDDPKDYANEAVADDSDLGSPSEDPVEPEPGEDEVREGEASIGEGPAEEPAEG